MNDDQLALNITKALAYTENGGKPNVGNLKAGKSGELKSMFQFLPSTWKLYAKQELGDANAPMTPENEALVVHGKVSNWVKHLKSEGVSYEEIPLKIGSMWNAGEAKQDAYKEGWKGTNSKGVSYDTPAYANKVAHYVKEFSKESPQGAQSSPQMAQSNPSGNVNKSVQALQDVMQKIGSQAQGVPQPQAPQMPQQGGLLGQLAVRQ